MKYGEARIALLDAGLDQMIVTAEDRDDAYDKAIEFDLGVAFGQFPQGDWRWSLVDLEDEGDGLVILVVAVDGEEQEAQVASVLNVTQTLTSAVLLEYAENKLYEAGVVG